MFGNATGGKFGADCEPHNRAEAIRCDGSDEVKSTQRGFEIRRKHRSSRDDFEIAPDIVAKEFQILEVHFVTCCGNDMIGDYFRERTVGRDEFEVNPSVGNGGPLKMAVEEERYLSNQPIPHEPATRRSQIVFYEPETLLFRDPHILVSVILFVVTAALAMESIIRLPILENK